MRILEQVNPDNSVTELIEIIAEDGRITSMLKSTYDELQAELKPAKTSKVVNAPVSE